MGRKKGSPSGGEVNPLQRMLGTYLRLERIKLGYSSAYVAHRLGLTDTYFRLAESGRAALNQSLVFKIIELFAASDAPTHDSRTISFNRLALFMVGTHWVGAEMASLEPLDSVGKRAMETLAELVSDFQIFYRQTREYFHIEDDSKEQIFLEDVAAPEVGEFLTSDVYGSEPDANRDFLRLDDLPTLNIDILLDLKKSLTGRSFVHTAGIAAKWESERASQFRYQRGIFRRPELIVDSANLEVFQYQFLGQRKFVASQMIFIDAEENEAELKARFINILNASRDRTREGKPITPTESDKVHFVCLTGTEQNMFRQQIESLLPRDSRSDEAYWSFGMQSGLEISFVGISHGNAENIRNLTLRDATAKSECFARLWNSIDAYRKN